MQKLVVPKLSNKKRLDSFLAEQYPSKNRSQWKRAVELGQVLVSEKKASPSLKLMEGEIINIADEDTNSGTLLPEDIAIDILFEDNALIVINKPAGLLVHPGAGANSGTLVNGLLHHCPNLNCGESDRPGIVHRLDKGTSGVMVCAKTPEAFEKLQTAFKERKVNKIYLALVVGKFKDKNFELRTGHDRHEKDRKRFTSKLPESEGKLAHSSFKVLGEKNDVSALEVKIHTGRTHQIRVHLADINRPIVGDTLYGGTKTLSRLKKTPTTTLAEKIHRQALHASKLELAHPISGEAMSFTAPLAEDLLELYSHLVVEKKA